MKKLELRNAKYSSVPSHNIKILLHPIYEYIECNKDGGNIYLLQTKRPSHSSSVWGLGKPMYLHPTMCFLVRGSFGKLSASFIFSVSNASFY